MREILKRRSIKEVCVYHEMEVEVIGIVFWERSQVILWLLQSNVLFLIIRKAKGKVCLCWVIIYALLVCGSCSQAIKELTEKEILHQILVQVTNSHPHYDKWLVFSSRDTSHLELAPDHTGFLAPPRHQSSPCNTRWSFLLKHAGICICYMVLGCTGWKILLVQVV